MVNIISIHPDSNFKQTLESVILPEPDWFLLLHETSFETFQDRFPKRARIDVAIIDSTQIDHIQDLKALSNKVKILVLCDVENQSDAMLAFYNGAFGYTLKEEIQKYQGLPVRIIIDGGAVISPVVGRSIIDSLAIPIYDNNNPQFNLTAKEVEVVHLLSLGYSYDKIASLQGISKNGVRFHLKKVYAKLNVKNRVDAVQKWINRR
jgi:DNA-binding NarL/FixJ family response regulator